MPALNLPDVRLNYHLAGSGPVVTLIHGLGTNMAFWYLGAARMLMQRYSVLIYDLRGHGASSMPAGGYTLQALSDDLAALHDSLGVERSHVVGHSHGARVALAYAARHGRRCETLTVADTQLRSMQPPMRLCEWPHWDTWKTELRAGGATGLPDDDALIDFRLLAELGQHMGGSSALRAGTKRRIDLNSRRVGPKGHRRWQELLSQTSAGAELQDESPLGRSALAALEIPVLLLYGKLSHCVPTSEALMDVLPNARRVLVAGAGHFFPIVKPLRFGRALMMFLATSAAGRAGVPPAARRGRMGARHMAMRAGAFAAEAGS